jgi:hypothetical protein
LALIPLYIGGVCTKITHDPVFSNCNENQDLKDFRELIMKKVIGLTRSGKGKMWNLLKFQ